MSKLTHQNNTNPMFHFVQPPLLLAFFRTALFLSVPFQALAQVEQLVCPSSDEGSCQGSRISTSQDPTAPRNRRPSHSLPSASLAEARVTSAGRTCGWFGARAESAAWWLRGGSGWFPIYPLQEPEGANPNPSNQAKPPIT